MVWCHYFKFTTIKDKFRISRWSLNRVMGSTVILCLVGRFQETKNVMQIWLDSTFLEPLFDFDFDLSDRKCYIVLGDLLTGLREFTVITSSMNMNSLTVAMVNTKYHSQSQYPCNYLRLLYEIYTAIAQYSKPLHFSLVDFCIIYRQSINVSLIWIISKGLNWGVISTSHTAGKYSLIP
jgi:hypothetical protein